MITISLTGVAFAILAWYFFMGGVEGRLRLFLFFLASGAVGFSGALAVRAWGVLQSGVHIGGQIGESVGNAAQLLAPHWPL